EALDAAEFRWQVEKALDARAVHDSDLPDEEMNDMPVDEDGPGYPALAVLVRARMSALPVPSKPAARHADEVDRSVGLTALQMLVQVAFGWDNSNLHVFETLYGRFGTVDAELGRRAEGPVTLEQVAPTVNSKLRYTYDFGDDWDHDIRIEKVLDRDDTATYPRCTGGRRAAPPEDCGGVWGYADLLE